MRRAVAITLLDSEAVQLEIEGALVASALGLELDAFRGLIGTGRISQLCERGTGEDLGRYRASFYYQGRRARFVLDQGGHIVDAPGGSDPVGVHG